MIINFYRVLTYSELLYVARMLAVHPETIEWALENGGIWGFNSEYEYTNFYTKCISDVFPTFPVTLERELLSLGYNGTYVEIVSNFNPRRLEPIYKNISAWIVDNCGEPKCI